MGGLSHGQPSLHEVAKDNMDMDAIFRLGGEEGGPDLLIEGGRA